MCGIAGVVAFDRSLACDRDTLAKMSARIAHRGPDGCGEYFSPAGSGADVALAHRRLAILDPDPRSNQPFGDGRRYLVFNGEIYNFRELRKELDWDWKTSGDTETLLAAYAAWGEKCVDHLNGMYAMAVWDSDAQSLFLARDRMGQKPLYLSVISGERDTLRAVAFASEIAAILPWAPVDRTIDRMGLMDYLRFGYVPSPGTIYRGVEQILPGEARVITAGGSRTRQYFQVNDARPAAGDAVGQTRRLVEQAVARQLVSDVPLGCFLSGGVDSSIIAAAMKRAVPADQKVLTFSIGFDEPRYDETQYATAMAQHLGTEHRAFTVRPDAAVDLPNLAAVFGQPMGDSSALPTHYLSRQTRQFVKVALSGDGGDELFGGYDRYRALQLTSKPLPWRLLRLLAGALPRGEAKSAGARLYRLLASAALPPPARYSAYMRLFDEAAIAALVTDYAAGSGHDRVEQLFAQALHLRDLVPAALCVDRQGYLPDDLLTKVDRCSMLHALEVRSPFMDPDLVDFAAGLGTPDLLTGGSKRLLRLAFAADLPAWVFKRKKMGFAVPIGQWLRGNLRSMLHDLLTARDSFASGHFHPAPVEQMIREHEERRVDHAQKLYALLMLELWWRDTKP